MLHYMNYVLKPNGAAYLYNVNKSFFEKQTKQVAEEIQRKETKSLMVCKF